MNIMPSAEQVAYTPAVEPFMHRMRGLYGEMDEAYKSVAAAHDFFCSGCQDNCCETWFFHHTMAEFFYIAEGCRLLPPDVLSQALARAAAVIHQVGQFHAKPEGFRTMCPLNHEGKCLIYTHRPMICRLHGVSYQFMMPNGLTQRGIGCQAFEGLAAQGDVQAVLDRTPFYRRMALLEQELRQALGIAAKIKMTVAEMLTMIKG